MPAFLGALTIVLFLGMELVRVLMLGKKGTKAFHFGNLDKKDFLIPPFPLFISILYSLMLSIFQP